MARKKVLITVMTYPTPSKSYIETVCTAGVTDEGKPIRLYPIDYRYQDEDAQFQLYSWVDVDVERQSKDPRPESFRPDLNSIKVVGHVDTQDNWAERKRYVLAQGVKTMCFLQSQSQRDVSLGIIKPKRIISFKPEEDSPEWSASQKAAFQQEHLFVDKKPLEKIPFKFILHYECQEEGCKGHKQSINDWGLCQLFRKQRDKHGVEVALEKVKSKIMDDVCGSDKDTYLFVGTVLEHGVWIIIGMFYPKRTDSQQGLLY